MYLNGIVDVDIRFVSTLCLVAFIFEKKTQQIEIVNNNFSFE